MKLHEFSGGCAMVEVVVIGGGWSGCAAAVSVKEAGGRVTLLERPICCWEQVQLVES